MRVIILVLVLAPCVHAAGPIIPLSARQVQAIRQIEVRQVQAMGLWKAGRRDEAIATLENALVETEAIHGPWHRSTEDVCHRLALWERARGRLMQARAYRERMHLSEWKLDRQGYTARIELRWLINTMIQVLGMDLGQLLRLAAAKQEDDLQARLHEQGRWREARAVGTRSAHAIGELLGKEHPYYANTVNSLACLSLDLGDYEGARKAFELSSSIRFYTLGATHPDCLDSLNSLAVLYLAMGDLKAALPAATRAVELQKDDVSKHNARYASSLNNLGVVHMRLGNQKTAMPLLQESLSCFRNSRGDNHPDYANCLTSMSDLYQAMGDYQSALPLAERALLIRKERQGEKHAQYAQALSSLANLHQAMGDFSSAMTFHQQALAIREGLFGVHSPFYASSLHNLGLLHLAMRDNKEALALTTRALEIRKRRFGEVHHSVASSLAAIAQIYHESGDYQNALRFSEKAVDIRRRTLGERHLDYAASLHELALLCREMGDYRRALLLLEQVQLLRKELLGVDHLQYGAVLNALGLLHTSLGTTAHASKSIKEAAASYRTAIRYHQEAREIVRKQFGEGHPSYATSTNNLAMVYMYVGESGKALFLMKKAYSARVLRPDPQNAKLINSLVGLGAIHSRAGESHKAMSLYQEALRLSGESVGTAHPQYVNVLINLGALTAAMDRPGMAQVYLDQAIAITQRELHSFSVVQSERQQLDSLNAYRYRLDWRLGVPEESAHFSHSHVLSWKGSSFRAQRARRLFVQAQADPAVRDLASRLLDTTRSLALLSSRHTDFARKRTEELSRLKEDQEAQLAVLSESFREAIRPLPSEKYRQLLPPGAVLIDYLGYTGLDPAKPAKGQQPQHRLAAWVLRADTPTARIDMGTIRPIEEAIVAWRRAMESGRDPGDAPARLRQMLWAPLEKHLAGARVVLVSPDRALGRLPFAALPGKEKGGYLLEEVPLAILPIPQMLPQLLKPAGGGRSLLAVGGVDFGDGPGSWQELPATTPEAESVVGRFQSRFKGKAVTLNGGKATHAALREALPKHRYAHLATHGYFLNKKSALDDDEDRERPLGMFGNEGVTGWHPGLLSGLVLAGANSPTPEEDGILTALEIAEMDLSGVELAVLSACQSGLGKEAGGEGLLGLQRAFAVAGCKSVVSSLWSVDDAATSVLMERFYHHLWEGKKSKIEALRQAQLDVLRQPERVDERVKALAKRGVAGLRGTGKASEVLTGGKPTRRSPVAWWGAWQLSGDWR